MTTARSPEYRMKNQHTAAVARKLALSVATADLARHFRAEGIPWLLLKGPSTAQWLYPAGDGGYGDIDVLVPEHELSHVRDALDALGYREKEGTRARKDGVFQRGDDPIFIDLHYQLNGAYAKPDHQWNVLSRRTESLVVGNEEVPVLSKPLRALVLALHAAHHGGEAKSLEDLKRAIHSFDLEGWDQAKKLAEDIEAIQYLGEGLRLHPEGVELAHQLRLPKTLTPELLLRLQPHHSAITIEKLLRQDRWRDRARFAFDLAVPPRRAMETRYPVAKLGRIGLFLAYFQRLLSLVIQTLISVPGWIRARREANRGNRS